MVSKKLIALGVLAGVAMVSWLYHEQAPTAPPHLTISGPFEFNSQDPSKDGYLFSRLQVIESLVGLDAQANIVPLLATQWSQSEDHLTWRFQLRPEVKFHDGSALTAEAVVKTLQVARQKPGVIRMLPIKSLYAEQHHLVIELTRPYQPLLSVLAHYTNAIIAPSSFDSEGKVTQIIGTGPYQVDRLQIPHKAFVKRFQAYWGEPAKINKVSYLAGHRAESRALLAQSGQADLVYTLDPVSKTTLQAADNVTLHINAMPRTVLIKLNNQHPFLNSAAVRRALSLSIDREGIAASVLQLPGTAANQLFSPALGVWFLADLANTKRDLATARELLAQAGWQPNNMGILERDGQPFQVELLTYSDRPELPLIATALQAQLREVGIDLQISIDNSSAIPAKHQDDTLEMALIARNFGVVANPLPLLLKDFATEKGSDWGPMHWHSDTFSALLQQLSQTYEPAKYQQQAQKAARLLADEMPLIPITYYSQLVAVNKRVGHFQFDPFEINYYPARMTLND